MLPDLSAVPGKAPVCPNVNSQLGLFDLQVVERLLAFFWLGPKDHNLVAENVEAS